MFTVTFRQDYGAPNFLVITNIAKLVSLSGFDALNYSLSVPQTGSSIVPATFVFRPIPFSATFFVSGQTRTEFQTRVNQIQSIFRQYRTADGAHRLLINNQETNVNYEAPVLIETVSLTQQTGLSATLVITGVRRTQGLFVGSVFSPLTVTTNTSGLPKTVTLDYPFSFPAPLRIVLTGPINAGFTLSRNDNLSRFDFNLTVGTSIPSGTSVIIDYGFGLLNGNNPIINAQYLSNPEIAPDITIRPQSITGNATNTFTLSGPSSAGSVTLSVNPMAWSIYE